MAEQTRKGYLRLNHFHGLRLESEDFETGEKYHVEKHRLHNRLMHGAGVVSLSFIMDAIAELSGQERSTSYNQSKAAE